MYTQSLYSIITPIKSNTISRLNKSKKWDYGYNKEHDIIVISKTGQIGDIYNIQNLRIALPKRPSNVDKANNKWTPEEYPKELKAINSIFDWRDYPDKFKSKWGEYIDEQFNKREGTFQTAERPSLRLRQRLLEPGAQPRHVAEAPHRPGLVDCDRSETAEDVRADERACDAC